MRLRLELVIGHDSIAVFARHKKSVLHRLLETMGRKKVNCSRIKIQDLSSDQTSVSTVFFLFYFFFFALNSKKNFFSFKK